MQKLPWRPQSWNITNILIRGFSTNSHLVSISPLDGRYSKQVDALRPYFSEFALMRFRVYVELEWYKRLFSEQIVTKDSSEINFIKSQHGHLDQIFKNFSQEDGLRVKEIERTTNHDVKAIEYLLKEKFEEKKDLANLKEYLHFSCTSEDINNLSYALMIHHSM